VPRVAFRGVKDEAALGARTKLDVLNAEQLGLNVPVYDSAAYTRPVSKASTAYLSPEGEKLDSIMRSLGSGPINSVAEI
jgi:outer membrane protein